MFITFIYRIGQSKQTYYGKYQADYISDDHEGLDVEVRYALFEGINSYRKQRGLSTIEGNKFKIGVLSFSNDECVPTYSSKYEIQCFDFYYETYNYKRKTYVNGKLIET